MSLIVEKIRKNDAFDSAIGRTHPQVTCAAAAGYSRDPGARPQKTRDPLHYWKSSLAFTPTRSP
jgi:hypothetical protein